MNSASIRARARSALAGRWVTLAIITFVYSLISSVAAYVYIGSLIVAGPLSVALAAISLKVIYGERVSVENLFDGFRQNFVNNFLLGLVNSLLIALWSLLLIVPGIIKSCAWSMSYFIAAENPGMPQSEVRKRSEEMMMGHKMEYFLLQLSFIGWAFLSIFTLGIGAFFLVPYMQVSSAAFYDNLKISQFVGDGYFMGGTNGTNDLNDDGSFSGPTGGSRFGRQSDSYDGGSSNNVFDNVFGSSKSSGNDDDDDYTIG